MELQPRSVGFWFFIIGAFDAIAQPLQDLTKFSMSFLVQWTLLLIRVFILTIPRCPTWNSLRILFWSDMSITTCLLYNSILLQIKYMSIFCWFVGFILSIIPFMNLLFDTFLLILSRITGSSHTLLNGVFFISTSSCREAVTVSSNGSLYFRISLDNPLTWLNFADGRNSILKL